MRSENNSFDGPTSGKFGPRMMHPTRSASDLSRVSKQNIRLSLEFINLINFKIYFIKLLKLNCKNFPVSISCTKQSCRYSQQFFRAVILLYKSRHDLEKNELL